MTKPALDLILHPVARLQIATVLANVDTAEFAKLRSIAGVSDSVLSKHLAVMVEAGFVKLSKSALGGRQRTWASLTGAGRRAFSGHLAALQAMVDAATSEAAE